MRNKFKFLKMYGFGFVVLSVFIIVLCTIISGCNGYSNESLYPENVESICLDMFENESFRRGVEYELTDALGKRIEAQTPYKIISSRDRADSIITGKIVSVDTSILSVERETGKALEKDVRVAAVVNWKNLNTGKLMLDNVKVSADASFSEWQNQSFDYASTLAANRLAQRIVELMEEKW